MSKKQKNIIDSAKEMFVNVVDELQTANTILYWITTEIEESNKKLDLLNDKIEQLLDKPLKVEVDYEKLADAIIMALGYTITQEEKTTEMTFKPPPKSVK